MTLKIERGKRWTPCLAGIYGPEGSGKSTLASEFPSPVILDTEDGTHHLDVARIRVASWEELLSNIAELAAPGGEFKTVVIDTADSAERMLSEHLCSQHKKPSIEAFGYGKGFSMMAEEFGRMMDQARSLVAFGMHVVFVAHSKVVRVSPPDLSDGYDRFELKLHKQVAPILKEKVDALLFVNYETRTIEGGDGRTKAVGGKRRVIHTERSAAWDAKNRYGLDAIVPMSIDALAPIFAEPARKLGWRDRVAQAATLADLERIGEDADKAVTAGKLTAEQRATLEESMAARLEQVQGVPA
jgi:hypothetical protein